MAIMYISTYTYNMKDHAKLMLMCISPSRSYVWTYVTLMMITHWQTKTYRTDIHILFQLWIRNIKAVFKVVFKVVGEIWKSKILIYAEEMGWVGSVEQVDLENTYLNTTIIQKWILLRSWNMTKNKPAASFSNTVSIYISYKISFSFYNVMNKT